MAKSYIPSKDADLGLWASNFSTVLSGDPGAYGFDAAAGTTVATYVAHYIAALTVVRDPSTNTLPNVADKDAKKAAMLDIIRVYAIQISQNRGISDEAKHAIGVTVRDSTPTPVTAPTTQPLLTIIGAIASQLTIGIADASTPGKRAKPVGAAGLQLFVAIGTAVETDPTKAAFMSFVTRTPFEADFNPSDTGKKATFFGRWQTARGLVGPWSVGVAMTIPG